MSKYIAKWAILKAENNGVITLKDKKVINGHDPIKTKREKSISLFGNIEEKLKNAEGNLSKEIKVLIITDKQFGKMNKTIDKEYWEAAMEVATTKQKENIHTIK